MNYHIFTLGCQQNYYDAKKIAHLLNKMGYLLSSEKAADLIIVLACSVRQKPVDRIYGKIRNWRKLPQKPKIIISACVLPSDKKKLANKVDVIIDSKEILKKLSKLLKLKTKSYKLQANKNFLPHDESKKTAYLPIMQGCDNFCSYCAVPYTRGREVSRSEQEIIEEIKTLIEQGYKKIVLLGQNVNSYQLKTQNSKVSEKNLLPVTGYMLHDFNNLEAKSYQLKVNDKIPFAALLKKIDKIPGNFTFNFLSSNPHDFTEDLIETLSRLKKWERVLHLPLQSGDDEILRKMNRSYTAKQYFKIIENCKLKIENLRLTTDLIVGFPGETKKQFSNTVKLCKKIGFSKAYISQYSPRPDTLSAREMNDDVPKQEKKRRWKILNKLINKEVRMF